MRRLLFAFVLLLPAQLGWTQKLTSQPQIVNPPASTAAPLPLDGSYRARLDSLLAALDKTQVPTGILYDRVFPTARLDAFGQTAADTSLYPHFLQANQELWYAAYRNVGLSASAVIRSRVAQISDGSVPFGILHYKFNVIDTLAVQNGTLSQPGGNNGALYDVAGRFQSPYQLRETLVVAALADEVKAGSVQFTLPANLTFDNTGTAVSTLNLDFNDGTAGLTLFPGGSVYKSFSTAGDYYVRVTASFTDSRSVVTYSKITVVGTAGIARNRDPNFPTIPACNVVDEEVPITASILFTDYEGKAYAGYGEVTTYYASCNNRQLAKPIIMLDGIDFNDATARNGKTVYSDFLNYYEQGAPKRLGEELRAAGNDVLVLDFPGANGAEYIQRNAFVLIQLIQNVNADLRSRGNTQKLTIIGPSMGGLVSRYALAYMERKFNDATDPATYQKPEWNHNTRLWVSFDSPQLGANIPIGDQQWLQYYAEVTENESAAKNLGNIDRPASREMLVQHYRSTSNTVSGAPGFRDRFQAELDNLGMPEQLRRIAVVNGSQTGIRQDWLDSSRKSTGCDQAFTFNAKLGKARLAYMKWLSIGPFISPVLSNSYVRFTPDYGGGCTTFHGETFLSASRSRYSVGRPNSISYDVAPGSWRSTQLTFAQEGTQTNVAMSGFFEKLWFGGVSHFGAVNTPTQTTRFRDVVSNHCFIPTVSALALTNANRDLGQNISGTDLVCTGETPFDSYFAPLQNEEHIFITPANAAYIKNEISGKIPTPAFVSPPTELCPGGSTQFSVKGECSRTDASGNALFPTTYVWTTSNPGLQIISGQGTATITVQAQPGFTGLVSVSVVATRAGYTPSDEIRTSLLVADGAVSATLFIISTTPCQYYTTRIQAESVNATGFRWTVNGVAKPEADDRAFLDITQSFLPSGQNPPPPKQIEVTALNVCSGATITATEQLYREPDLDCGTIRNRQIAIYPNPADEQTEVVVEDTDPQSGAKGHAHFQVTLHDGKGKPVRQASTTTGKVHLNTATLPPGLYHVQVHLGNQVFHRQLSIQH